MFGKGFPVFARPSFVFGRASRASRQDSFVFALGSWVFGPGTLAFGIPGSCSVGAFVFADRGLRDQETEEGRASWR
jgi:hypothetical protein